ncbi:MAG: hypothetical protein J7501_17875 [Bdellovibrio sp.]|nr:hypothetical protein [Bdellovibrio sp.]
MMTAITFVFIAICLVEAALIAREFRGSSRNTKSTSSELLKAQQDLKTLSEKLMKSEIDLEQAQKEIQGIHALWNKALLSEQGLRRDLEIAKTQLTYLAQSLMKAKSETKTYWTEEPARTQAQMPAASELRAFKSTTELIQKDFI